MTRLLAWIRRRLWQSVFLPPHHSMDPRLRVCPTCGHCDRYLTGEQIDAMLDEALRRVEARKAAR